MRGSRRGEVATASRCVAAGDETIMEEEAQHARRHGWVDALPGDDDVRDDLLDARAAAICLADVPTSGARVAWQQLELGATRPTKQRRAARSSVWR